METNSSPPEYGQQTNSSPPMAMAVASIPISAPVAMAVQPNRNQQQLSEPYTLTPKQKLGAVKLGRYSILLLVSSIFSSISPGTVWMLPVDMIMSIVTASLGIHWTCTGNLPKVPMHSYQTCCGFHAIYGMALASSILNALFGSGRLLLFLFVQERYWFNWAQRSPGVYYFFALFPSICSVLATISAAIVCSYSAPNPGQASFTEYDQVVGAKTPLEAPISCCCSPKKSRCICWSVAIFFMVGLIALAAGLANGYYRRCSYYFSYYSYCDYYYNYYYYYDYNDYDYYGDYTFYYRDYEYYSSTGS